MTLHEVITSILIVLIVVCLLFPAADRRRQEDRRTLVVPSPMPMLELPLPPQDDRREGVLVVVADEHQEALKPDSSKQSIDVEVLLWRASGMPEAGRSELIRRVLENRDGQHGLFVDSLLEDLGAKVERRAHWQEWEERALQEAKVAIKRGETDTQKLSSMLLEAPPQSEAKKLITKYLETIQSATAD